MWWAASFRSSLRSAGLMSVVDDAVRGGGMLCDGLGENGGQQRETRDGFGWGLGCGDGDGSL